MRNSHAPIKPNGNYKLQLREEVMRSRNVARSNIYPPSFNGNYERTTHTSKSNNRSGTSRCDSGPSRSKTLISGKLSNWAGLSWMNLFNKNLIAGNFRLIPMGTVRPRIKSIFSGYGSVWSRLLFLFSSFNIHTRINLNLADWKGILSASGYGSRQKKLVAEYVGRILELLGAPRVSKELWYR